MPIHSDKNTEQIAEGAGAPALLLNVTCVVATGNISGTQVAGGS